MNILLILDKDAKTEISEYLRARIIRMLAEKGNQVEVIELWKNDALPCLGCFSYCLIKHPGECIPTPTQHPPFSVFRFLIAD